MDSQIIDFLNGLQHGSEAARIDHFEVYIGSRPVTVRVADRGPEAGDLRYSAEADWEQYGDDETPGSKRSVGNPAGRLSDALDNVHWWQFSPSED